MVLSYLIITEITNDNKIKRAVLIFSQPAYRTIINKFIEKADLGFKTLIVKIDSYLNKKLFLDRDILDIWYDRELKDFELYTLHDVYDQYFKKEGTMLFEMLKSESNGLINFFIIASLLSYAIKKGQLVFIDEIDSQVHSFLLLFLVTTCNYAKINTLGSQLIFTSHNTVLLNMKVLGRNQVIFVEKNEYGETSIRRMHS